MPRTIAPLVAREGNGQIGVIAVRAETDPLARDLAVTRAPEGRQPGYVDRTVNA